LNTASHCGASIPAYEKSAKLMRRWQLNSFTSLGHLAATFPERREMRGMPKSEPAAAAADEDKLAISIYTLVCVCGRINVEVNISI
jgi:hypothetical protein